MSRNNFVIKTKIVEYCIYFLLISSLKFSLNYFISFCADFITKPAYCDIYSNIFPLSRIEQPNIYNSTHFFSRTLFTQCKLCRVNGCRNPVMFFKQSRNILINYLNDY